MLLFLHTQSKMLGGSAGLLSPLLLSWNVVFLWHFMCFDPKALSSQLWSDETLLFFCNHSGGFSP